MEIDSFFKKYRLISEIKDVEKYKSEKQFKTCKYCGLDNSGTSFNEKPHALSELFGKNQVTSNFECDKCNHKFEKFENDLSTFIQPFLTLCNVRSKKKVPTFRSRKLSDNLRTEIKATASERRISLGDESDIIINQKQKVVKIRIKRQSLVPLKVYKSLARIGIVMLDYPELDNYEEFIDWLIEKDIAPYGVAKLFVARHFLYHKYFEKPFANLYRANLNIEENTFRPELVLIIGFANIVLQVFYPYTVGNLGNLEKSNLELELYPASLLYDKVLNNYQMKFEIFDLSSIQKEQFDEEISFKFSDLENTNR